MLITYGAIATIVITGSIIENRCRVAGNTVGALSARRFTRIFVLTAGALIAIDWLTAAAALITLR